VGGDNHAGIPQSNENRNKTPMLTNQMGFRAKKGYRKRRGESRKNEEEGKRKNHQRDSSTYSKKGNRTKANGGEETFVAGKIKWGKVEGPAGEATPAPNQE